MGSFRRGWLRVYAFANWVCLPFERLLTPPTAEQMLAKTQVRIERERLRSEVLRKMLEAERELATVRAENAALRREIAGTGKPKRKGKQEMIDLSKARKVR